MSNPLVEGLFLLACWAPPLAIAAGALLLLVPTFAERPAAVPSHAAPMTH